MVSKITLLALMLISLFGFKGLNQINNSDSGNTGDTIVWSDSYKLGWNDFKGVPNDPNRKVKALTISGIYIQQIRTKGVLPKYKITARFVKSASWTKTNDEEHLKHEQLHFDITELYARKLRKSFDSLNNAKVVVKAQYHKVSERNFAKWERYEEAYDKEVYGNEVKQQEWIDEIAAQLATLKNYQVK